MRNNAGQGRRRPVAVLLLQGLIASLLPLGLIASSAPSAEALPAGFSEQTIFSGLNQPMAVEFGDDGRVFVAEKSGLIKVFDGLGDPTATVVADLRTKVYNEGDRGLMSIALAPTFPIDPSIYVLYAHDAAIGGTAPRWGSPGVTDDICAEGDGCVISGRLSKLNTSLAGGGTEQVLIEDWCQQYSLHSVGDLAFGPDGYLYASGGEGANYTFADYGQAGSPLNPCGDPPTGVGGTQTVPSAEGGALRSQDIQTLADPMTLDGSVIRIDPATGEGATGNPMITSTDPNARRIVGTGLRNPFRFAFRPGGSELWLGDVGWSSREEINRLTNPLDGDVDNFGWPCREGDGTNGYNIGLTSCNRIFNGTVPTLGPHYTYAHGQPIISGDGCPANGGSSISALAFYEGGTYPPEYDGAAFFADYSRGCIWVMFPGADGVPDPSTRTLFRQATAFPVDLATGPNGDLYYVDIGSGAVRRIRYAQGDQPPVAAITASPTQGPLPLTVSFSAAAATDPEDQTLTYAWDLDGDGTFTDATGPTASRTYTVAGLYNPAVRVSDPGGQADVASRPILAGSTPPTATINVPDPLFTWAVGEDITFSGSATDPEDGPLPASALSWRIVLHHCRTIDSCHEHPLTGFGGVAGGTIEGPDHEYPAYLELRLTATDSTGVTTTASRRLDPKVGELTIETDPPGLTATLSSKTDMAPFTAQAIVGSRLTLSTPDTHTVGPNSYAFTGWSDGAARVHDIFVGAAPTTYRATFTRVSGSDDTLITSYSFDDGAGSTLADRTGKGHHGTLAGPTWSTAGHTGGALSFDGIDDLVSIADADDLDLTTGLTLEAWVRPTALTEWRTAIMKEHPSGLSYAMYAAGPETPSGYVMVGADRSATGDAALPANAWSHLAVTYDASTLRLYLNGAEVANTVLTGPVTTSVSPLRLGGNTIWGEYFAGLIDDVRIYNRALTAAEVSSDRDTPVSGDSAPPTQPTNLTATGGQGTAQLVWTGSTDNVGVIGYDVHRSTTSGFTPTPATRIATVLPTNHVDTGVAPGTYYYRVTARDAAGNVSPVSGQASATILADTTPPTVSVTAPAAGSTVAGTMPVAASAADDGGLAGVQFQVDGAPIGAEDTTTPYDVNWTTTTVAPGSHALTAVARDVAGNTTTSLPVAVTVANDTVPPTVAVTAPSQGATVSGSIAVTASATDDTSVFGVQLQVDGAPLGAEDVTAPYSTTWDTTTVPNGSHALTAVARDASGNSTTSATVTVDVQNAGPPPGAPVAAYNFDEGTGATLFDRSGRGNNGAVSGAAWSTSGHTAGALSFDGVDDLVTVADSATLDLTTAMTVEAWVRPTTSAGWRTALLKEGVGGLVYALYSAGPGQPSGYIEAAGGDRDVTGPTAVQTAAWSHLALTYDDTTMRLYVDGNQVATRAQTAAISTSTAPLRFGGNTVWGEFFSGLLDDVRIYDRALTAAQIVADRDTPVAGDTTAPSVPTGLVATGDPGSVQLSWTAATDNVAVTGYDVHRSTTAGFPISAGTQVATVASTSFTDAGLQPGTYHYKVVARDGAGNASGPSAEASATATADTTPPTVSVTAPAAGSTVAGSSVAVTATAADAGGVVGVQFRVDGTALGAEDTAAPYQVSWNTTTLPNGSHTVTAVARDASGNTTTSAGATVTVDNITPQPGAPIASYSFDDGAGTSLIDRTGTGHTGTIAGATWSAAGHTGGALSFDGVNDLVTIADASDLDLTNAMTLEAWVRPTSATGWRTVLMKEQPGGLAYSLYGSDAGGRPTATIRVETSDRDAIGPSALPANTWSHLAATYDGTTLRLYVDGTQVGTFAVSGNMATSTSPLRIGGNIVWTEFFAGLVDDVRVYNRALTPAEINTDRTTPVT